MDYGDLPKPPDQGMRKSIDPLLQTTILNKDKGSRRDLFAKAWGERWNTDPKVNYKQRGRFQTLPEESPFSKYSSKGWKIHIAFEKGKERDVAESLFLDGLYFKIESEMGTYFNGSKESGATVYIGSYDNMMQIAEAMNRNLGRYLTDGAVANFSTHTVRIGSGSDVEILPKITARFDVAKTPYGWAAGNGKYAEHGLPTWWNAGGIPILKRDARDVERILDNWGKMTPGQKKIYKEGTMDRALLSSRVELIKDFGKEFVFGKAA